MDLKIERGEIMSSGQINDFDEDFEELISFVHEYERLTEAHNDYNGLQKRTSSGTKSKHGQRNASNSSSLTCANSKRSSFKMMDILSNDGLRKLEFKSSNLCPYPNSNSNNTSAAMNNNFQFVNGQGYRIMHSVARGPDGGNYPQFYYVPDYAAQGNPKGTFLNLFSYNRTTENNHFFGRNSQRWE